jgi:hypothetical protein
MSGNSSKINSLETQFKSLTSHRKFLIAQGKSMKTANPCGFSFPGASLPPGNTCTCAKNELPALDKIIPWKRA